MNVTAGLDRGGYVWARSGFLPSQESWDALRPVLRDKILDPRLDLTPAVRQPLLEFLQNRDPHAIWHIADSRTPVVIDGKPIMLGDKPLPLGNHLLSNTDWAGNLDLNDAKAMGRFDDYVGPKK